MHTISRDSYFYRGVPAQWEPLSGFIGENFWRYLPRRGNHVRQQVPQALYYPVWLGPPNNGRWLRYTESLHLAKSGPGRLFPRYPTTMRGPWGVVDYQETDVGNIVTQAEGLATDVFAKALGAVAKIFPSRYRTTIEIALTAAAAAWSAGALSGLLLNAMPALEPVLAKKIAGQLVDQVLSPKLVLGALAAPPPPPDMDIGKLVGQLMGPLDGMAARSARKDPADGVGKAMATAAAVVIHAGASATAQQKSALQTAATAVAQLQSNLAILVTLAFTNTIRANLWDTTPSKFYGGWSPDEWFKWAQSLPRKLDVKAPPRTGRKAGHWYGVENFNVDQCKLCVWPDAMQAAIKAQGAPTARRDCLRVYFTAAGIPARVADWVQGMIEASPAASAKARKGDTIVHVIMQAASDAVHTAVAVHAQPTNPAPTVAKASGTPPALQPAAVTVPTHKPGKLAPLLVGATLLGKALLTMGA